MKTYTIDPVAGKPYPSYNAGSQALPADPDYLLKKYGIANNSFEIDHFRCHHLVWTDFLHLPEEEHCLVVEKGLRLRVTEMEMKRWVDQLPEGWDVFFPFDKRKWEKSALLELYATSTGVYWGSHIYFLSKNGAEKLSRIKVIRQPVDEELLILSASGRLNTYFTDLNAFDYDEKASVAYRERNKALSTAIFNFPGWNQQDRESIRRLMRILCSLASQLGIALVLHGGTLLGHVRHGKIMPWDDDIDLGIARTEIERFLQAMKEEGRVAYSIIPHQKPNSFSYFYKFWLIDGADIEGQDYKFPFVDLWMYDQEEGRITYKEGYVFPEEIYLPFLPADFEGTGVKVPAQPIKALDILYKDWRQFIRVYQWSHRLEKAVFQPLTLPITTDENGMIC
jgi:hypothetical protein